MQPKTRAKKTNAHCALGNSQIYKYRITVPSLQKDYISVSAPRRCNKMSASADFVCSGPSIGQSKHNNNNSNCNFNFPLQDALTGLQIVHKKRRESE